MGMWLVEQLAARLLRNSAVVSDVTAGIFALGGAIVGGLATLAGTVWEQHRQSRTARSERLEEMAKAGVDAAMTELLEVQTALRAAKTQVPSAKGSSYEEPPSTFMAAFLGKDLTPEERDERLHHMMDCRSRISIAMQRVPSYELRVRVDIDTSIIFGLPPTESESAFTRNMEVCRDAEWCLGAYLRGEPLPSLMPTVAKAHAEWRKFSSEYNAAWHRKHHTL
ncbi:hypothetical protein [Streptomyces gardneri]|uniref:hypothetical protein n=1 Tax=Streptomyces gardneri TaxID=66892 RepID=UPI0035D6901C